MKKTRHFGGKTEGFSSKREQRQEQKHLRAYLRGWNNYIFGYSTSGSPIRHPVIEEWYA